MNIRKNLVNPQLVNRKDFESSQRTAQASQQDIHSSAEIGGSWFPVVLVGIYFLSLWKPPAWPLADFRWYIVLGLAVAAFLMAKKKLSMYTIRALWIVYGVSLLGAILSLLRASDFNRATWNTVGMGINFLSCLLFMPTLASRKTRHFLLVILVGISILWTLEIQRLVTMHGALYISTFGETGENKNNIGMSLSLACISLFYLSVFWKPSKITSKPLLFVMRLGLGILAIFLFYNLVIIYARSNVLATFLGVIIVLAVMIIKPQNSSGGWRIIAVLLIIAGTIVFLLPRILTVAPRWNDFSNFQNDGLSVIGTYDVRTLLIQKGLFLIRQNPFIGVGVGGSRFAAYDNQNYFPQYLLHNTFLADWVEKGILGLLSNAIWVVLYFKTLRNRYFSLSLVDQIWLILFMLIFFEMNFINMSSISYFMLALFAGICADEQRNPERLKYTSLYKTRSL